MKGMKKEKEGKRGVRVRERRKGVIEARKKIRREQVRREDNRGEKFTVIIKMKERKIREKREKERYGEEGKSGERETFYRAMR